VVNEGRAHCSARETNSVRFAEPENGVIEAMRDVVERLARKLGKL